MNTISLTFRSPAVVDKQSFRELINQYIDEFKQDAEVVAEAAKKAGKAEDVWSYYKYDKDDVLAVFGITTHMPGAVSPMMFQTKYIAPKISNSEAQKRNDIRLVEDEPYVHDLQVFRYRAGSNKQQVMFELVFSSIAPLPMMLPVPFILYCLTHNIKLYDVNNNEIRTAPSLVQNKDIWTVNINQGPQLIIFSNKGEVNAYDVGTALTGLVETSMVSNMFDTEHRDTIFSGKDAGGYKIERVYLHNNSMSKLDFEREDPIAFNNMALFYKKTVYTFYSDPMPELGYTAAAEYLILSTLATYHKAVLLDDTALMKVWKQTGLAEFDFEKAAQDQAMLDQIKKLKKELADAAREKIVLVDKLAAYEKNGVPAAKSADIAALQTRAEAAEADALNAEIKLEEANKKIRELTAKADAYSAIKTKSTGSLFDDRLKALETEEIFPGEIIYVLNKILTEEETRLAGIPEHTRRKDLLPLIKDIFAAYGLSTFPEDTEKALMGTFTSLSGTLTPGDVQTLQRLGFSAEMDGQTHFKLYLTKAPKYSTRMSGTTSNPAGRCGSGKALIKLLFK